MSRIRLPALCLALSLAAGLASCGPGAGGAKRVEAALASLATSVGPVTPAFDPAVSSYAVGPTTADAIRFTSGAKLASS